MAATTGGSRVPDLIERHETSLLAEWTSYQKLAIRSKAGSISDAQLLQQSSHFLNLLATAMRSDDVSRDSKEWNEVRTLLGDLSRSRALQGFSPSETATFVFSLKRPLFDRIRQELSSDPQLLGDEIWRLTENLDGLGLYTTEVYQKSREEVIQRQQQEMLELSTPVIQLWEGILAIPLIGTLDSARTQVVMETLLSSIVENGARIAIIDITGVPTVDTLVAQHLLKTVSAARLMGAECIISGIRPQIAQTIVHLGVDLGDVTTKASLAAALQMALLRGGMRVSQTGAPP